MYRRGWRSRTSAAVLMGLLLAVLAGPSGALAQELNTMALGLSWKGYVDTNLKFSQFFAKDHTLAVRFMPQFPNAYEGPFVAEKGSGTFVIGQGDFLSGTAETKLYLAVGSQARSYPTSLQAGRWYHLAIVASTSGTQRLFTLYLNGTKLGQPLSVAANDPQMPSGTLRFGKRTTGQTVNGHNAQFYGFLDDIAVFNRKLSTSTIKSIGASTYQLKGDESGLVAGYTFEQGALPTKLSRPVTLRGAAERISVSTDRNSSDANRLPLPSQHMPMTLPFKPGEAWEVVQGYDTAGGSHKGDASFTWDFVLAGFPDEHEYPAGSGGAPLYAAAPGRVVTVKESESVGTNVSNLVEIEQAPGEIYGYLHLRQNSADVNVNDTVTRGRQVAQVGASGMGACHDCNHLHFGVTDKPDGTSGFVTFPIAFSNYEVRDANGYWRRILRGIPKAGEIIRRVKTNYDYDGDGRSDLAVFRPTDGTWHIINSSTGGGWNQQWGSWIDAPVPGDYDGDGRTDLAVWRPDPAVWHIINSSTGGGWSQQWGTWGDIPAPGDYDGDGRTDLAVWRPTDTTWYIINSSTGAWWTKQQGAHGDIPAPGDYDGDGRTDLAIWRPSNGTWYIINSSTGAAWNQQWGANGDTPAPGDYDGDGRTDLAVWWPDEGTWYVVNSSTGDISNSQWGARGDIPVPGDYDGDGRTDITVWRPADGIWYVVNSSTGAWWSQQWGINGDKPV